MPDAVWNEVVLSRKQDIAAQKLPTRDGYRKLPPVIADTDIQLWNLGPGESEVMHHIRQMALDRTIIDDQAARCCCRSLEIRTLGTSGILVVAKRRGIISELQPAIQKLRDAGLWLSDSLIHSLLLQVGEI